MAINHTAPGDVIDLANLTGPGTEKTTTLFKTQRLEVIRLVLPAGKRIPPHAVPREVTVQCLSGRISFEARNSLRTLEPGGLLYLEGGDIHSLEALEDATVLVTIVLAG